MPLRFCVTYSLFANVKRQKLINKSFAQPLFYICTHFCCYIIRVSSSTKWIEPRDLNLTLIKSEPFESIRQIRPVQNWKLLSYLNQSDKAGGCGPSPALPNVLIRHEFDKMRTLFGVCDVHAYRSFRRISAGHEALISDVYFRRGLIIMWDEAAWLAAPGV